ncbi:MAG: transposase [Minisyncoccota bacterium]
MQRSFIFSTDEFYHLYNRGVERRAIFLDDDDRARFTALLYVCNSKDPIYISNFSDWRSVDFFVLPRGERLVDIGAYCLMPNHFHLLVKEPAGDNTSIFMRKLLTGYSMYFNKKYHRTGALFEGAYKARHVNNDEYLKYLFAYIHLNPVKLIESGWKESGIRDRKSAQRYLEQYSYSSYLDYVDAEKRSARRILQRAVFPEYFSKPAEFSNFIDDWLTFKDDLVTARTSRQGLSLP